MLSTEVFQTRSAKLIAAVVAVLLLAAFQVALQAKPAHAWEMKVTITGAGSVVETTPAHLLNCSTSSTNPTGQVGATCFAGTPSGDYGNFWDVDYTATPASGYTFKRWESDGTTRLPIICDRSDPPATTATYSGSNICKFRATGNLQTRVVFADEQNPSTPSITNTTPTSTNQAVSFSFQQPSSDPTFKQFQCRVTPTVQTSFQPCTSGISFNPSDGTYTFEVRAVDLSGNTSSSASRTWTVDKTGPTFVINSTPPQVTNSTSATFTFSSPDPSAQFLCKLDNALFYSTCFSPKTYTGLTEGQHSFTLTAQDSLGNASGFVQSIGWRVDLTPPETTLDPNVGPIGGSTTQNNDPVFAFSSPEVSATFECNLTGPGMTSTAFASCTSPKSYTNLPDGTYTFKARAKDSVGNADATPAERTWTIDNVAPAAPVIDTPAGGSLLGTDAFTVSGTAEANSSVKLFDQGVLQDTVDANSSGNWSVNLSGVTDGSHTYTAKATDAANNTSGASAATTVTVDAKDPTVIKWTPTGKKVSARTNVTAFFSEDMVGNSVEAPGTFTLKKKGSAKALGATVTYIKTTTSTGSTYKALLNPSRNLKAGATYGATVTSAATDLSGNPLVAKTWTFTVKP